MTFMDRMRFKSAIKRGNRRIKRAYRRFDLDDMLESMGLERRNPTIDVLSDLGFFTLGCLCEGILGLFYAPSNGRQIRTQIKKAIDEKGVWTGVRDSVRTQLNQPQT